MTFWVAIRQALVANAQLLEASGRGLWCDGVGRQYIAIADDRWYNANVTIARGGLTPAFPSRFRKSDATIRRGGH
jgi:hypothetical protein